MMRKIFCSACLFIFIYLFFINTEKKYHYDIFSPIGKRPDLIYERYNEFAAQSYFFTMIEIVEKSNNADILKYISTSSLDEIYDYYKFIYKYDDNINTPLCFMMGYFLKKLTNKLTENEYCILISKFGDDGFYVFMVLLKNMGSKIKNVENYSNSIYSSYCWKLGILGLNNYLYFYEKYRYDISVSDDLRKKWFF